MRDNFIKRLIEIDNFFFLNQSDELKTILIKEMHERGFKTLKELFSQGGWDNLYTEIDLSNIKQITLNNSDKVNPFIKLYSLSDKLLNDFFSIFYKTHFALRYYEIYCDDYRSLKDQNKDNRNSRPRSNAIDKVLSTIHSITINQDDDEANKVIDYLENLKRTLENRHYTKRQVYQDFFYNIYFLLIDESYCDEHKKIKKINQTDVRSIVNGIIREYFQDDDNGKFKGHPGFNKYETYKYNYHTKAGITLTHPKFK